MSELIYTAMQVCLTNAVQYAKATELAACIRKNDDIVTVMIRNNGKQPEQPVREGGGLTNLRRRIEAGRRDNAYTKFTGIYSLY